MGFQGYKRGRLVLALSLCCAAGGALAPSAEAGWGGRCSAGENHHCYATAGRNIQRYGGVLASIVYVDTTGVNANDGVVNEEQWINFPGTERDNGDWIEAGQTSGIRENGSYECCTMRPFYAEMGPGKDKYQVHEDENAVPQNSYNHYVLFDAEVNGGWDIYWGNTLVGRYGGGWPAYLTEQEAGIEVASEARPSEWGRDQTYASDGGAWSSWATGVEYFYNSGICAEQNTEFPTVEGDIMWGTQGYDECLHAEP
ncbi:MAG: hypothetical protein WBV77_04480 [Solirubrobacteraceae bacterium]